LREGEATLGPDRKEGRKVRGRGESELKEEEAGKGEEGRTREEARFARFI